MKRSVSVIIPCLNEAATLGRVLRRLRGLRGLAQVLVVDNGSTDGSAVLARRRGAEVLPWPRRGYGAAVRAGLGKAKHPWILCLDADDSCDSSSAPLLLERLAKGADLAIGSRRLDGRAQPHIDPLHHQLGTPALTWLANTLHGAGGSTRLSDVTSGFFAVRRRRLGELDLQSDGFDLNIELFSLALRRRWKIEEVAVRQLPATPGRRPHLRTWPDGWRLFHRVVAGVGR